MPCGRQIIDPGVSEPGGGRGPGRGGAWRPRGAAQTARACRPPAARRPRMTWRRARRAARGGGRIAPAPTRVQRGGGEAVSRRWWCGGGERDAPCRRRRRDKRGGGGVWGPRPPGSPVWAAPPNARPAGLPPDTAPPPRHHRLPGEVHQWSPVQCC